MVMSFVALEAQNIRPLRNSAKVADKRLGNKMLKINELKNIAEWTDEGKLALSFLLDSTRLDSRPTVYI